MIMLELKRLNVRLDRDVIFLVEASEEGSTEAAQVGIDFMVNQHFADAADLAVSHHGQRRLPHQRHPI